MTSFKVRSRITAACLNLKFNASRTLKGQCGSLEELHFMETSFDVATCVANPSWGPDLTNIRHLSAPATLRYDTLRFMQILSSEALLPNLTHLTIIFDGKNIDLQGQGIN